MDTERRRVLELELSSLSRAELDVRHREYDSKLSTLRNTERRMKRELSETSETIKAYEHRIKLQSKLPHLVANVAEILDMEAEDIPEDEIDRPVNSRALQSSRPERTRTTKCAVIKTTTRQTIFLPEVGLVDPATLKPDDLVGVNRDTHLILSTLPKEYDSRAKAMEVDTAPKDKYTDIGGLEKQIQEMIEAVVLPITNKAQYQAIGITPPKGVLLYGAPGTGKTLLARACAAQTSACFLKLAGPQLVQMYIGDGARIVRDAFALAKQKAPSIIFIDELDAIGLRRGNEEESTGIREVQRTMLELLYQLDGFGSLDEVKVIAATNRIDVLDPALLRSGRLDRKVEFPMPDVEARAHILEIHSRRMALDTEINFEELARCTDDMNGAQLKAVAVEAGMLALKHNRRKVGHEDFVEGIAVVQAKKKAALNYFA